MSPLTDRQRNLLNLANQLSQNLITTSSNLNKNISIDLPGLNLDTGLNLGRDRSETPPETDPEQPEVPDAPTPTTMRDVLLSLVNEQVEVTTPFGIVTGTLLAVRDDYIVIVENTGSQVLVRIDNIELVSDL